MKRTLILSILLVCIGFTNVSHSQVTPLDTQYRKVSITGMAGASSFLKSPMTGVLLNIDITDNKYPLIIKWENGFMRSIDQTVFMFDLGAGIRFKNYDILICPFGFYQFAHDFTPTMGIAFNYRPFAGSPVYNKFTFSVKTSYYYHYIRPGEIGFNASLNYRLCKLKKI